MTLIGKNCGEAPIDKRAGQGRFRRSTASVTKSARKTHNPSVVGSSPTCPTPVTGRLCREDRRQRRPERLLRGWQALEDELVEDLTAP